MKRLLALILWLTLSATDAGAQVQQTFPVNFHVISAQEKLGIIPLEVIRGDVTDEQIARQMDALNAGFAQTPFRFRLAGVTRIRRTEWFHQWFQSPTEREMKVRLRQGGADALNVYTVDLFPGFLGFSSWPQEYAKQPALDGVLLDYGALPGGREDDYNTGKVLVHETGHWLSLQHTSTFTSAIVGICGSDNFMAQGDPDKCLTTFTPVQIQLMIFAARAYRTPAP